MVFEVRVQTLPREFVTAVEDNLGKDNAHNWLIHAVEDANRLAWEWRIAPDGVLTGGVLSLCVLCTDRSNAKVVIKIPADTESGRSEIAALSSWKMGTTPRLLQVDEKSSAFLIEYISAVDNPIEAHDVFNLADSLHKNSANLDFKFPNLKTILDIRVDWAEERFLNPKYSHWQSDLAIAKRIIQRLLETTSETVLLHGDLQRKNLIVSPDGLRAIDPFACIGDSVFDSAFWLGLVHHDAPLLDILKRYSVGRSTEEYRRFLCWTWVVSVVENRPYEQLGTLERAEFISELRELVASESELL